MTGSIPARAARRAATKYVEEMRRPDLGLGPCFISTYSTGSHGYAQIGWQNDEGKVEMTTGQRAAWVHHEGPIPDSLTVDHLCHVRPCVRREHLRLLTRSENAMGQEQKRTNVAIGRLCRVCDDDLVAGPNRVGYCRTCQNRRRRARRAAGKKN